MHCTYDCQWIFIYFHLFWDENYQFIYNIFKAKEQSKLQMEKMYLNHKNSNQASIFQRQKLYRIRGKLGKIQITLPKSLSKQKSKRLNRMNSYSPRRNKPNFAILFKQARQVKSCQTYLQNQLQTKLKVSKEPPSPKVFTIKEIKNLESYNDSNKPKKFSINTNQEDFHAKKEKNIYKTIQITIDGKEFDLKNKQKLLTTLSQIILNHQGSKDNFSIEILDESVIVGNQQNCFGMSEVLLIGEMIVKKSNCQAK